MATAEMFIKSGDYFTLRENVKMPPSDLSLLDGLIALESNETLSKRFLAENKINTMIHPLLFFDKGLKVGQRQFDLVLLETLVNQAGDPSRPLVTAELMDDGTRSAQHIVYSTAQAPKRLLLLDAGEEELVYVPGWNELQVLAWLSDPSRLFRQIHMSEMFIESSQPFPKFIDVSRLYRHMLDNLLFQPSQTKMYKDAKHIELSEGFAVLQLEVWADVCEHPMITRQLLAQIAENNGDPYFTNKLQKLLHGYGKQTLHYLDISSKQVDKTTQERKIEPQCKALLAVSPDGYCWIDYLRGWLSTYKEYEFPESQMPENIKSFKQLKIRHCDHEVLAFLEKLKPLFTNVVLKMKITSSAKNMDILLAHFLPMIGSIHAIHCDHPWVDFFEWHFQGTLARAKELHLFQARPASIPACLNWLNAPQDFGVHGPRFLTGCAKSETIFEIIDAVRKQFLAATTSSSAFVIYLQFYPYESRQRADELTFENTITKEQLTIRNAIFKDNYGDNTDYVEVLRHSNGDEAKMREWIEKRAYYEKIDDEANKEIRIDKPTIGCITKEIEDKPANVSDNDADGPSTSARK